MWRTKLRCYRWRQCNCMVEAEAHEKRLVTGTQDSSLGGHFVPGFSGGCLTGQCSVTLWGLCAFRFVRFSRVDQRACCSIAGDDWFWGDSGICCIPYSCGVGVARARRHNRQQGESVVGPARFTTWRCSASGHWRQGRMTRVVPEVIGAEVGPGRLASVPSQFTPAGAPVVVPADAVGGCRPGLRSRRPSQQFHRGMADAQDGPAAPCPRRHGATGLGWTALR